MSDVLTFAESIVLILPVSLLVLIVRSGYEATSEQFTFSRNHGLISADRNLISSKCLKLLLVIL